LFSGVANRLTKLVKVTLDTAYCTQLVNGLKQIAVSKTSAVVILSFVSTLASGPHCTLGNGNYAIYAASQFG